VHAAVTPPGEFNRHIVGLIEVIAEFRNPR
jgi:hypothetical protein